MTEDIGEGEIFLWTGAWYDPDFDHAPNRHKHGNPNVLTHDHRISQLAQGPAAQNALIRIERFIGDLPELMAFFPALRF